MKLDRNINRGGRGEYALVNMRKMIPVLDRCQAHSHDSGSCNEPTAEESGLAHCFTVLVEAGIITLGNEAPGEQFFVMKYKDKFAHEGLMAYAEAVNAAAHRLQFEARKLSGEARTKLQAEAISLAEYHKQMCAEANTAFELGNRIPD